MNELTIATTAPVTDDELQARLRQIREYKADAIKTVDAAKDALTADNYRKEKLNAFDSIDKKQNAVSHIEHTLDLATEVAMTRSINHIDFHPFICD